MRTKLCLTAAFLCAVLARTPALRAESPTEIRVDFGQIVGMIRPLHGVNGGPLCRGETVDLTTAWREAGIPVTRLHDVEWPRPDLVDMHAVFPDPGADPKDERSYDFAKTDDYLAAVAASGAKIVYRLGESIEHSRTKHHVHPPADPDRWAAACVGVIRHYNEGWASGTRYGITYWEVWNEPENRPACWTGSDEDYFRLYAAAAKAIKSHDPRLKVGGPAVGSVGEAEAGEFRPTPFVAAFVRRCRERSLPLDFFSWHHYADDPSTYAVKARAIRRWLDAEGFRNAEIHLNEWNYLPGNDWGPLLASGQGLPRRRWAAEMAGPAGAAFAAYVLADLQDSPIDVANHFRGDASAFGLFDEHGAPNKSYFAFKAFHSLLDTPLRVKTEGAEPGRTAVCAGVDEARSSATILLANYRSESGRFALSLDRLPWDGPTTVRVDRLDEARDLEPVLEREVTGPAPRIELDVLTPSVTVLRLTRAASP